MGFNPLDFNPLQINNLQTMDKQSKQYKKAIQDLRQRHRGHVYYLINHFEPNDFTYNIFRVKYRKRFFTTIIFLVLAIIALVVAIGSIGEHEINEFTKSETIKFIIFVATEILTLSVAMFFAFKARKIMDDCVDVLIEQTKIKSSRFLQRYSEQLLSDVSSAYSHTMDNLEIMDDKEKCGCINCLNIFYSAEIKNFKDDSVTCPYCNTENVIGESCGYEITSEFLTSMREYWIDS